MRVQSYFGRRGMLARDVETVNAWRAEYARLDDRQLEQRARASDATREAVIALAAVTAHRVLGLEMFDEQIQAAIGVTEGHVVEMQTGEGKTLAAVPAVAWLARTCGHVHVLTANDYLAQRDAEWMGGIYARLGLSTAAVGQAASIDERRAAYAADVTYATANEVGFDYLRDGLAFDAGRQVLRPFAAVVIDEADSILIDEARIPLVIAGANADEHDVAMRADRAVRDLSSGRHFTVERSARNVTLTAAGVSRVERALGFDNLFDEAQLATHTAVQDALHAHALLRRDVDYVVEDGEVRLVDEFKGRIVPDRRWPAGLHAALEAKEGVARRRAGRVLGSITVEHLIGLYPHVSGMTGTAATQADEFRDVYDLDVEVIPPHRPIVRDDRPDVVFGTRTAKETAVLDEVRRLHTVGRPVLVGTSSVEESERLSGGLSDVPHHVLNARHEAAEAAIVQRAGERRAVTISTNMAGRGVDIRLGPGVAKLGGLHVIGTNRHESRRIDHQLRGRAGRQGDPGSSQFLLSKEDPLLVRYAGGDRDVPPDQYQRMAEGQNLESRIFLRRYESILEAQRRTIAARRQEVLTDSALNDSPRERRVRLATIDDLWADYLAAAADMRSGSAWITLGYGDALGHYLRQVDRMFGELTTTLEHETATRLADPAHDPPAEIDRGATWTYLTTDEPFGQMTTRILKELVRRRAMKRRRRTRRRRPNEPQL